MYYHVQVSLKDGSPVNSLDNSDLEDVKQKVLAYLLGDDFFLGGTTVHANQIKSLSVAKSRDTSSECVSLAYSRMPVGVKDVISPEACVFGDKRFSEDITESIIAGLRDNPRLRKRYGPIEIWTRGSSPERLADLPSTITSLYETAKDLLDSETERRYRNFRLKIILVGLINYAVFVYALIKFDFHHIVHPAIIVGELTLHLLLLFFLLFGKEYEPREFLKNRKEKIRRQVYDDVDFKELEIRKK